MSSQESIIVLPYEPAAGRNPQDLSGQRFGRLVAKSLVYVVKGNKRRTAWMCLCDCGKAKPIQTTLLLSAKTQSCGCLKEESRIQAGRNNAKHLMCETPTYASWHAMRERCSNPRCKDWPRYGKRGITICDRWNSFANFLSDMGERPKGTTIDRKEVNGNYEPENCRWATPTEQQRNRRCNKKITIHGETKTLAEWAEIAGMNPTSLSRRLGRGISPEDAISAPKQEVRLITINNEAKTLTEWAAIAGITASALHYRLKRGVSPENAIR